MSIFASILRSVYKLSGAKKAFALPEDALQKEIEKQNRRRGVFTPTDRKAYYETIAVNGFPYSADEVLYGALPDFEKACKRANVPYTVSARPKMGHCYCMLPIFKEAKEDFAKIVDILKK